MFKKYYSIVDSDEKKFIIMQDDKDGRLAILKSISENIVKRLKNIDKTNENLSEIYEFGRDYIIEANVEGIKVLDFLENSQITMADFVKIISDICKGLTEYYKI